MLALLTRFGLIDPPEGGRTGRESERVGCPGATNSGNLSFIFLARRCVEGRGRHTGERMDMCGDLWYLAVAVNQFICLLFGCINIRSHRPSRIK